MDSGLVNAVVPVVITLLGTMTIGLVGGWFKFYLERRSVRFAIYAEIQALVLIIRKREYLEGMIETIKEFEEGKYKKGTCVIYSASIDPSYCRVYSALVSTLGSLPADAAQLVVIFYQLIDSVVRDLSPGGQLHEGTDDVTVFNEASDLLSKALRVAEELQRIEHGGLWLQVKRLLRLESRDSLIHSLRNGSA
ncbi:hypothetical protein [Pseudomonas sp. KU43P]|uniref:hypothetical protein n=1 Tax=Pseudomonas sp. KU43P TaxID=2487887 RepID=UPI0012A8A4DE|nr:hypothetical protein [Pseudomonas sp. KU43P]BBH45480.1 hypothetical protein KU43P_19570 [Pseudomonas sp. KU43P]